MAIDVAGNQIAVTGQLDGRSVSELRDAIYWLLDHEESITLDLSGVEAADLTALRMIAATTALADRAGVRIAVQDCPRVVRRLLALSHLRKHVHVEDSRLPA